MTSLPLMGILRGTNPPPVTPEENIETSQEGLADYMTPIGVEAEVVKQEMVLIPAGEFFRGTNEGGYNERPLGLLYLPSFWIDKYEVTNHHYSEFVESNGASAAWTSITVCQKASPFEGGEPTGCVRLLG